MSLTSFQGMLDSIMKLLYNSSLLTESKISLKPTNSLGTVSLYSHFSSVSDEYKILSVVDLLCQN
jgi:hypothetical protein